jgi:predicted transcriptional regulator
MKPRHYWMAVTSDKYELPICVEESCEALARKLGKSVSVIKTNEHRHRNGKRNGYKIVKALIDTED